MVVEAKVMVVADLTEDGCLRKKVAVVAEREKSKRFGVVVW